jgi:hypothetical protein
MQMIGRKNRNNPFSVSGSHLRRSGGLLLLIGVLAGVTVGGGVGVIAASTTKTVTVCANKKTNVLRYAKNGKCAKTETKVLLNQTGADGSAGAKGADGSAGAKGDTGTAGVIGATGAKGADGAVGTKGADGVKGDAGAAGSSFTARSVCGTNGTTLCAIGVQGPGGGTVFYVDTEGKYSDFDYLEVAPADASTSVAWTTNVSNCGLQQTLPCHSNFLMRSGEALNFLAIGTGQAATTAIVSRLSPDPAGVLKSDYAAGIADEYTTPTATDWFLPSRDELNEACKYALATGQQAGATTTCRGAGTLRVGFSQTYWSSSESGTGEAHTQAFISGDSLYNSKNEMASVRPVRSF